MYSCIQVIASLGTGRNSLGTRLCLCCGALHTRWKKQSGYEAQDCVELVHCVPGFQKTGLAMVLKIKNSVSLCHRDIFVGCSSHCLTIVSSSLNAHNQLVTDTCTYTVCTHTHSCSGQVSCAGMLVSRSPLIHSVTAMNNVKCTFVNGSVQDAEMP